ncbi:hypothetical protein [Hymenobacter sp. IS2118]|uniref:hypothetical protein n=1 Tax=Hymenobacter sp. IS2118 TaxID=1505605 RepID=UPI00054E34B9|nr:hypothetical protein [Hymenobacter sp. IS2118]
MRLTTNWDTIFAIRFGAVNDLWQADANREARWRNVLRQQVSAAWAGANALQFAGTASWGGTYAGAVTVTGTQPRNGVEQLVLASAKVTYRLREVLVLEGGTDYNNPLTALSFAPAAADGDTIRAATFDFAYGLATVRFVKGEKPLLFHTPPLIKFHRWQRGCGRVSPQNQRR